MSRAQWIKTVKRIVERDQTCQLRLPGCTDTAQTADHIVPRSANGSNEDDNLRGSCHHCNRSRGDGSRRRSGSAVTINQNQYDSNQFSNKSRSDQPKLVPWIG
jgi:5-methylcytosine-specific restriction endonuclease McrA